RGPARKSSCPTVACITGLPRTNEGISRIRCRVVGPYYQSFLGNRYVNPAKISQRVLVLVRPRLKPPSRTRKRLTEYDGARSNPVAFDFVSGWEKCHSSPDIEKLPTMGREIESVCPNWAR